MLTCDVSGTDVGRPHLSGSHRIVLLNAKADMSIFRGFPFMSASVIGLLTVALSLLESLKSHPTTLEELQTGPSATTLLLFPDFVANGQVPKTLHLLIRRAFTTGREMSREAFRCSTEGSLLMLQTPFDTKPHSGVLEVNKMRTEGRGDADGRERILNLSDLFEEFEIVDVGCVCEVNDPGKPVILHMIQRHVPLVVGLRCWISKVLLERQVSVHDAGLPQHLGRHGGCGAGLDYDPEQRRGHQLQGAGQSPQECLLQPVVGASRRYDDQLPIQMRLRRFSHWNLSHYAPVSDARVGELLQGRHGLRRPVRGADAAGEDGGGARGGKAGEEAHHEAQGEVDEGLLPQLDPLPRSVERAHVPFLLRIWFKEEVAKRGQPRRGTDRVSSTT